MIYVDHGLYRRALCTSKSIGMSPDAIQSRLDSTRLDSTRMVVNFAEQVSSATPSC